MTISEERLRQTLVDHGMTQNRADEVIADLRTPAPAAETTATSPTGRSQRLLVVSDPQGQCAGLELTGWVVKVDENFPISNLGPTLVGAGVDHNLAQRRATNMVDNVGQVIEGVSARLLRERGVYRQHREAVFVTFVRGTLRDRMVNPPDEVMPATTRIPRPAPVIAGSPAIESGAEEEQPQPAPAPTPVILPPEDDSMEA